MAAPIYVKVDKYNEINKTMADIKSKIIEAKKILARVVELKEQEDTEVSLWKQDLETVEQRINQIDDTLPKPDT